MRYTIDTLVRERASLGRRTVFMSASETVKFGDLDRYATDLVESLHSF